MVVAIFMATLAENPIAVQGSLSVQGVNRNMGLPQSVDPDT